MSNNTVIKRNLKIPIKPIIPKKDTFGECIKNLGAGKTKEDNFICIDRAIAQSGTKKVSLESWEYLKKRPKSLKLKRSDLNNPSRVFQKKHNYLQVCNQGQIMVVYPDGVLYRQATPEVIERITQEHLIGYKVVQNSVFFAHLLPVTSLHLSELVKE
jgi:(2Fe-2S) ferredoxin